MRAELVAQLLDLGAHRRALQVARALLLARRCPLGHAARLLDLPLEVIGRRLCLKPEPIKDNTTKN